MSLYVRHLPLTVLLVGATSFAPAEAVDCNAAASKATPLTKEQIPFVLWTDPPRDRYETTAQFKKRILVAQATYDTEGKAKLEGKTFSFRQRVSVKYDADKQRMTFSFSPFHPATVNSAGRKVSVLNFTAPFSESRSDTRLGNPMLSMNVHATRESTFGMAILGPLRSPFATGHELSLRMPPAKARELGEQIDVLVVGAAASPWIAETRSSGDSDFAPESDGGKGAFYTSSYSAEFVVVKPLCAAMVSRKDGTLLVNLD